MNDNRFLFLLKTIKEYKNFPDDVIYNIVSYEVGDIFDAIIDDNLDAFLLLKKIYKGYDTMEMLIYSFNYVSDNIINWIIKNEKNQIKDKYNNYPLYYYILSNEYNEYKEDFKYDFKNENKKYTIYYELYAENFKNSNSQEYMINKISNINKIEIIGKLIKYSLKINEISDNERNENNEIFVKTINKIDYLLDQIVKYELNGVLEQIINLRINYIFDIAKKIKNSHKHIMFTILTKIIETKK